jgi:ribosomal subunit interface protein
MNIQIHAKDFSLTEALRAHVTRRLAYALNHGQDVVSRTSVRLTDVNGLRGGVDKSCAIEVRMKGAADLIVEDVQDDIYVAIDRASERIGRLLDRRLAQLREHAGVARRVRESLVVGDSD